MVKSDARWVACALDCEGNISLSKHKCKKTHCGYTWQGGTAITNCNLDFIKELQRVIGFGLYNFNHAHIVNGKKIYRLYFSPKQTAKLLSQIEPYLIIKKKHSQLLREALPLVLLGMGGARTPQQLERLLEIHRQIRELNIGKRHLKYNGMETSG